MPDDYIKRSDAIFALCGNCEMIEACGMTGDLCDDVKRIEAIPAADVEPKSSTGWWIPVTERLPENDSGVLAFYDDGIESRIIPATFHPKSGWYDCLFNMPSENISYWMPLPEPPKEEEHE